MFSKFSLLAFMFLSVFFLRCTKEEKPMEPVAPPAPEAPANMDAPEVTPLPPEDDLTEPSPDQSLESKPAAKPAKKAKDAPKVKSKKKK